MGEGSVGVRDEKRYGRWGNNTFSGAKRGLEYRKTPPSVHCVKMQRRKQGPSTPTDSQGETLRADSCL